MIWVWFFFSFSLLFLLLLEFLWWTFTAQMETTAFIRLSNSHGTLTVLYYLSQDSKHKNNRKGNSNQPSIILQDLILFLSQTAVSQGSEVVPITG